MPSNEKKGPELKERIIAAFNADRKRPLKSIAEEIGCAPSTVKYHTKAMRVPGRRYDGPSPSKKILPPDTIKQIKNLTVRGLSARAIAEELGVTAYMVYCVRNANGLEKSIDVRPTLPANPLALKALEMKNSGMRTPEIAKRLGKSVKSIYSMMYYQNRKKKGLESNNGHNTNGTTASTNGHGNGFGPSKAELIGFAWAQVERGLADIAQRIALPPDLVRRRVSELLGYSALR